MSAPGLRNTRGRQDIRFSEGGPIMKKNLTEIVFIIDKSGSMSGLEKDTIGGFNSMLKKQKQTVQILKHLAEKLMS